MIQLECSNCKALLAIDDAFAGGVCRCQHCGTIQTVPKPGREEKDAGDSPKALFKRKARIESALSPYSEGLDRAADEMGSSGDLSANALAHVPGKRSPSPVGDVDDAAERGSARAVTAAVSAPPAAPAATAPPVAVASSASAEGIAAASARARSGYVPKPSNAAKAAVVTADADSGGKAKTVIGAAIGLALIGAAAYIVLKPSAPKAKPITPSEVPQVVNAPVVQPPTPVLPTIQPVIPTVNVNQPTSPELTTPPQPTETAPVALQPIDPLMVIHQPPKTDPSIAGIPLSGHTIVYVVDRSSVTAPVFANMLNTCIRSAESLGAERKFQIVIWNNYRDIAYPADKPAEAIPATIEGAKAAIGETFVGTTNLIALLNRAVDAGASDIVLMSAADIDQLQVTQMSDVATTKGIRLHTIAIAGEKGGETLKAAATASGGEFRRIPLELMR